MALTLNGMMLERHSQTLLKKTTGFDSSYRELFLCQEKKYKIFAYEMGGRRGWESGEREGWESFGKYSYIYIFFPLFHF